MENPPIIVPRKILPSSFSIVLSQSRPFDLCRGCFASYFAGIHLLLRIVSFSETSMVSSFGAPYRRSSLIFLSLSNLQLFIGAGSILLSHGPNSGDSGSILPCQILLTPSAIVVL